MPLFRRFKLGAVLGYLAAGVIIGPWGLKFITAVDNILHFAELGVVLLLFVIGLGLAMSSTAFVLQILAEKGQLTARHGRSSFAILLFQDLAVIPLLALIPLLGAGDAHTVAGSAWLGALKAIGVIIAVIAGGRYLLRPVLQVIAASGIQEIFTAAALRQPALLWRRCTPRSAARRRCRHGRDPGAGDRRRGSFVAYCRNRSQASSTRTVTGTISAGGTRRYSGRATFADASDW